MTKFMLLMNMDGGNCDTPMLEWDEPDMKAHMQYLGDNLERLRQSGELVEAQALTGPELAKVVTSGVGPRRSSPTGRSRSSRSCWPATSWSTSSRRSGPSRSRRRSPRVPGPDGVPLAAADRGTAGDGRSDSSC